MGGIVVFSVAIVVFFKALRSGSKVKLGFAALFLAFATLLLVGGIYLRYQVEVRG